MVKGNEKKVGMSFSFFFKSATKIADYEDTYLFLPPKNTIYKSRTQELRKISKKKVEEAETRARESNRMAKGHLGAFGGPPLAERRRLGLAARSLAHGLLQPRRRSLEHLHLEGVEREREREREEHTQK